MFEYLFLQIMVNQEQTKKNICDKIYKQIHDFVFFMALPFENLFLDFPFIYKLPVHLHWMVQIFLSSRFLTLHMIRLRVERSTFCLHGNTHKQTVLLEKSFNLANMLSNWDFPSPLSKNRKEIQALKRRFYIQKGFIVKHAHHKD